LLAKDPIIRLLSRRKPREKETRNLILFFLFTFAWTWAFYAPMAIGGHNPYEMPWLICSFEWARRWSGSHMPHLQQGGRDCGSAFSQELASAVADHLLIFPAIWPEYRN
jgi:hypothetical protein